MVTIRKKIFCLILAMTMLIMALTGCSGGDGSEGDASGESEVITDSAGNPVNLDELSTKTISEESAVLPEYSGSDTLTIGYEAANGDYSPIFAQEDGDMAVSDLVSVTLLERGRDGSVLRKSADGTSETYEGTEYSRQGIADVTVNGNEYEFTLNEDVYFSDGVNLTADDVIFTMYVLADPAYDGVSEFSELPIKGLEEYTGENEQIWHSIVRDLQNGESKPGDEYTEEDVEAFEEAFNSVGYDFTKKIVDYCVDTYGSEYSQFALGKSVDEIRGNEGLAVAFAEFFWGYASGTGDDGLWYDNSGRAYDLKSTYPTIEEYWQLIVEKHGYDMSDSGINYENVAQDKSFYELLKENIDENYPGLAVASASGDTADYISGIEKTGMYSLRVTMTEYESANLDGLDIPILPLHYYGDRDSYKYTEHRFGFEKGDLSKVKQLSESPLGAGPYEFVSAGDDGVTLQRNVNYYRGCPNITNINIVFCDAKDAEKLVSSGAIDIFTDYTPELRTNDGLTISLPDYSYFGINAEKVKVGREPYSDESKSLRRAFLDVFMMHLSSEKEENDDAAYGALTPVFKERSEELTASYGTPEEAAKSLLQEAGYTWSGTAGKFTSSSGGAMTFEIRLRTDELSGTSGRAAAVKTAETFTCLGITVTVTEYSNGEVLQKLLDEGEVEMWISSTGITDSKTVASMFTQGGKTNYFGVGQDGTEKQVYTWKKAITESQRKMEFEKLMEHLYGEGVFTELYRYSGEMYVSSRVVVDTIPGDMTYYHTWIDEVEKLELY